MQSRAKRLNLLNFVQVLCPLWLIFLPQGAQRNSQDLSRQSGRKNIEELTALKRA
jgi:hypothetical protein